MSFKFNFAVPTENRDENRNEISDPCHDVSSSLSTSCPQPGCERPMLPSAAVNTKPSDTLRPFQEHVIASSLTLDGSQYGGHTASDDGGAAWSCMRVGDADIEYVSPSWIDERLSRIPDESTSETDRRPLKSDIRPMVYEGGFRIWDGARDLLSFLELKDSTQFLGKRVLELGCGAGLPGIFALMKGAEVHFHDYNSDVIQTATFPNILRNINNTHASDDACAECRSRVRGFSGDWLEIVNHLDLGGSVEDEKTRYDLVLTGDTVYRKDVLEKLCHVIPRLLRKDGIVYLAGKSHYFGLDGGTDALRDHLKETKQMRILQVEEYPDAVRREVLVLTHDRRNLTKY